MSLRPLRANRLYRRCDLKQLAFSTTEELQDLDQVLGQQRAIQALELAIGVQADGYNLYALGPSGLGRHRLIARFIDSTRRQRSVPGEWCYVHNFDDPTRPRALCLPAGLSKQLSADMDQLIQELLAAITVALESDEFRARKDAIEEEFKERQERGLKEIQQRAKEHNVAMIHTPAGIGFAPMADGEVIKPAQYGELSDEEKKKIEQVIEELQSQLQELMQQVPRQVRAGRKRMRELSREVITLAVREPVDELRKRYSDHEKVQAYLDAVHQDVIDSASDLIAAQEAGGDKKQVLPGGMPGVSSLNRYKVNVLVERGDAEGAPLVYEVNPNYNNLIGQVEHIQQMGALVTDFRLIKPGALHRANGGYLVLDARRLLQQPFAYEALKQALRTREICIESIGQMLSLVSTVSLEPEPIPLDVKVVLVGERLLYYMLCHLDPDFRNLFKIAADFAEEIDWNTEHVPIYARLVGTLAKRNALRPLNRPAVARVIERSARLCGDSEKISIRVESIADLLREADYFCRADGRDTIEEVHIEQAVDAEIRRNSRLRERLQEQIVRETMLVDTEGEQVGQVNALAVIQLGNYAFGRPSRITATVRLGKGDIVDIEREVQLGGPLHSKGVMILAGFLGARFGQQRPLALAARLVFEQSYAGVDGDSASSAELYALLSALAQVPLRQALAVTGSVNQHGQVQAIGGVNDKIEGFFDLCAARGLTGQQGVLIPQANVKHLMLASRVREAVKAKQFQVYAAQTVDEGIEVLTGVPAGKRGAKGRYPRNSINGRVQQRLDAFAEAARAFSKTNDKAREEKP